MLLYGLHQSIQGLALSGGQISNLIVARNGVFEHVGGRKALQKPNQAQTDSIQRREICSSGPGKCGVRQSVCLNHTTTNFRDTIYCA
jgi:hypothetical protein